MKRQVMTVALCVIALPASAKSLSYDCDTGADRYSEIGAPFAANDTLSGVVTPTRFTIGGSKITSSRISIDDDTDGSGAGVQIFRTGGTSDDTLTVVLAVFRAGKKEETALGTVKLGQPVPFNLTYKSGSVAVQFGDWTRVVDIAFTKQPKAVVSCSTGEFEFSALDFGR